MVEITETLRDILKHYFLQMNIVRFAEVYIVKNYLKFTDKFKECSTVIRNGADSLHTAWIHWVLSADM